MATTIIRCYVAPQSTVYADGLERLVLHVRPQFTHAVVAELPPLGKRVAVAVVTRIGRYRGGLLKWNKAIDEIYLCPDLVAESDHRRTTVARVLRDCGIEARTDVDVRIEDGTWFIPAKLNRSI